MPQFHDYIIRDHAIVLEVTPSESLGELYNEVQKILIDKLIQGDGVCIENHADMNPPLNFGVPMITNVVSVWEISYAHLNYRRFLIIRD